MKIADTRQIEELLGDLAFPASKERIVEHAHARRPLTEAERALSSLPLGTYGSAAEVLRSLPIDPDPGRTPAEQAYRQRHHNKPGLAEHMRDTERPPVQDELRGDEGERWQP
ncbi:DUF2795 domain-containing protein [Actinomadura sp. NTSP31]|uniref:DUF2795 domain-containing protein n=1 Tax=Actinomadura sp. NTSP31 TaxID=1735447 RepID=UPI0035C1AC6A